MGTMRGAQVSDRAPFDDQGMEFTVKRGIRVLSSQVMENNPEIICGKVSGLPPSNCYSENRG